MRRLRLPSSAFCADLNTHQVSVQLASGCFVASAISHVPVMLHPSTGFSAYHAEPRTYPRHVPASPGSWQ